MASDNREARRRKIVERGSDRLALITGQLHNISPSSPYAVSSPHGFSLSSPHSLLSPTPASSPRTLPNLPEIQPPPGKNSDFSDADDKSSGSTSTLAKDNLSTETAQMKDFNSRRVPQLHEIGASLRRISTPSSEGGGNIQSSRLSSTVRSSSKSTARSGSHPEQGTHKVNTRFTPNRISAAITAADGIRLYCSIIVSLSAVLSHMGFPILRSSFIKNTLLSRPLFLVLLTDITFVLVSLLSRNERGSEKDANKVPLEQEYGLADQLGKALEIGLLLQKAFDALVMECSIYAVIVVCGLALVW